MGANIFLPAPSFLCNCYFLLTNDMPTETDNDGLGRIDVRLPQWVLDYFKEKSQKLSIPKSTLLRSMVVKCVKAEMDEESKDETINKI